MPNDAPGQLTDFSIVGLNYRTAPLHILEQFSITRAHIPDSLSIIRKYMDQAVILSTCNRFEIYSLGHIQQSSENVHGFLSEYFGLNPSSIDKYIYRYAGKDCIWHLLRVAAGLDSMIVGEGEILQQIRHAYASAVQSNMTHGTLSHLFHQCLRVGRKVRRDTSIGRNSVSMSKAYIELASKSLGNLNNLSVIIIGTGEAGKLAAKALHSNGIGEITITNRTLEKAISLANELGGRAIEFTEMPTSLIDADIIVISTGSPGYLIDEKTIRGIMSARPERKLFIIDMAIPRDVDPKVSTIGNVIVKDTEDLHGISQAHRIERKHESSKAERIVKQEVEGFVKWFDSLDISPTIASLRLKANKIRETEINKFLSKNHDRLSDEQIESLEAMTKAIINKILHYPTTYIKEKPSLDKLRTTRELFNLSNKKRST